MSAVTIHNDFGAQVNKICHCFHFFSFYLPWRDGTRCHDLSFFESWISNHLFHSLLSPTSRSSLVFLHFLPVEGYHLRIWGCWYFSWQSWFQSVSHPPQHFIWSTLHNSVCKLNKQGDNIQPCHTLFPILNQPIAPCLGLLFLDPHTGFWGDR